MDIVLTGSDLPQIDTASVDFTIACQVIEHLPNPLGGLEVWSSKVVDYGSVYITFPVGKWCADKSRPINTLKHFIYDYENQTSSCTDEDMLAFCWAWRPEQFPDPASVEAALNHVWANELVDLDEEAWRLLGPDNREAVEKILSNKNEEIHHHVFDMAVLLESVEWLNERTPYILAPVDIAYGKGLLSEHILILRRYPKDFAESPVGRAVLDGHRRHVAAALAAETWTEDYVIEVNEFIQYQRRILDDRLQIIESAAASSSAPRRQAAR